MLNDYLDEDPSSRAKSPRRTKSPPVVMQVDNLEGAGAAGGYGAPAEDEGGRFKNFVVWCKDGGGLAM